MKAINGVDYLMALTEKCQAARIAPSVIGTDYYFGSDSLYNRFQTANDIPDGHNKEFDTKGYMIDSFHANDLPTMEEKDLLRKSDIAKINQRMAKGSKIGEYMGTLLIARTKGLKETTDYNNAIRLAPDFANDQDYMIMLQRELAKKFDSWYFLGSAKELPKQTFPAQA